MKSSMARREFLALAAASAHAQQPEIPIVDGVPRVDYHAHPEHDMTVERAIAISRRRGVKFGLLEHAGVKETPTSERIGSDGELKSWIRSLAGKPVFKGIQAEGMNWMPLFSREAVAQLDYVLSDALTMPDRSGKPIKLWTPAFTCDDAQEFMDRYVDFHLEVMARQPLDILANPTFLPELIASQYDALWTEKRMRRIVEAAVKHGVAIEINSRYRVPRLRFLEMAKAAGARFSFGSNAHTADAIGDIAYCVEMYRKLGLNVDRFFRPASYGKKPIQVRTLA